MSFMLLGILNAQATGGGAGAFDLLETTTLASSASSVTFTGLDAYSDYKHLQIRAIGRSDKASDSDYIKVFFNADSAANYSAHRLAGTGSSVISSGYGSTSFPDGSYFPAASNTSNIFGVSVIDFLDFSSSNKNTTLRASNGFAGSAGNYVALHSSGWFNSSAVTSLSLNLNSSNFIAGSRFSLYGVK